MKRCSALLLTVVFSLSFFCFPFHTSAQDDQGKFNLFKDVIPPAPTSASLGKFGNIPIGLHTGTPNISIPLYNVKGRALSVPISLSYHASGMRVEEVASWVGSGWSLNAGGVVTRTIHGIADERAGGYIHAPEIPELPIDEAANLQYFCDVAMRNLWDSEPDVFNFNINGYSGEFFFSQDGEAHTVPYQNIDIETIDPSPDWTTGSGPNRYSFRAFKITTPDGIQYFLGQDDINGVSTKEMSFSVSNCGEDSPDLNNGPSAWYLNRILHPNGEEINFTYTANEVSYSISASETEHVSIGGSNDPPIDGGCPLALNYNTICTNTYTSSSPKLAGISSEFFNAEFVLDHAIREDLSGGVSLDKIIIKNNLNDILQEYDLQYSYFDAGTGNSNDRYHLKLDAVHSNCQPPYEFEYIGDGFFPSRLSKARDHWGYYNGANSNSSLIPVIEYAGEVVGSANREPDVESMEIGTLNKVTYPTGGWTLFEYEPHEFGNFNPITEEVVENLYISTAFSTEEEPENLDIETFSVTGSAGSGVFEASFNFGLNGIPEEEFIYARLDKILPNGTTEELAFFPPSNNVTPLELNLDIGNYQLVTYTSEEGTRATLRADVTEAIEIDPVTSKMTGGVRIKRMTDFSASEAPPVVKEYSYLMDRDGEEVSSGHINHKPKYISSTTKVIHPIWFPVAGTTATNPDWFNYCDYKAFVSKSNIPLFYQSGSPVGYEKVKVNYPDGGESNYTYTVAQDVGVATFPFAPFVSMNWKRGLLLNKTETGAGGTRTEINNYRFVDDGSYGRAPGLTIKMAWKHPLLPLCGDPNYPNSYWYDYKTFLRISPAIFLDSKTVILDGVSATTDYTYNPVTLNQISSEMENSDGSVYRSETEYAEEIQNSCMLAQFIHNVPLTSRQYVDGQLAGGMITDFTAQGSMCLPTTFSEVLHDGTVLSRGSATYFTQSGPLNGQLQTYQQYSTPLTHNYSYFSSGMKAGLMQTRSFGAWGWNYDYEESIRQLESVLDQNNIESTYRYDDCQRLTSVSERNGMLASTFEYVYNLAEGNGLNYVKSTNSGANTTVFQYLDGLGRPVANVSEDYSPDERDVVQGAYEYDELGRPYKQYLPYLGIAAGAFVFPGNEFETILYEASPLGRETGKIFADGSAISIAYGSNTAADNVIDHSSGTNYPAGELYRKDITDENGNTTSSFTDKVGRSILTRRYLDGGNVDTYNVYDYRGNLMSVLPPGGTSYTYTYDNQNRLLSKTIPGGGTTEYEYNDRDQIVSSTDAKSNNTIFTYDDYGRLLTQFTNGIQVAVNTYDSAAGASIGQLATTETEILDGSGTKLLTNFAYDNVGRVINTNAANHLNGSDNITNTYDGGTDQVVNILRQHSGHENISTTDNFVLDHRKRMTEAWFDMSGSINTKVASMKYDFKDRMVEKNLGFNVETGTYLQSVDYHYNIRNWLTYINKTNPNIGDLEIGSCESLPEQPIAECGDVVVDLEALLELRLSGELLSVDCYDECQNYPVPTTGGGNTLLRTARNNQITTVINNKQFSEITYPTKMSRVQFTDGREALLLRDELGLFFGDYTKQECVDITDGNQDVPVKTSNGSELVKFNQLLELRKSETPIFEVPNECEEDQCLFNLNYSAHSVFFHQGPSFFREGEAEYWPGGINSLNETLEEDGVIGSYVYSAELIWDLKFDYAVQTGDVPDKYEVSLKSLSHIKYGKEQQRLYIGLHDGSNFLSINNGQNYLDLSNVSPQELNLILTPDFLPSYLQMTNMKLIVWTNGKIDLDAVLVDFDYTSTCDDNDGEIEPCGTPIPDCSSEEQTLQMRSLEDIYAAAENITVDDLDYPLYLVRVKLCNGDEVYLFDYELDDLYGDYITLHYISVSSGDQTFDVDLGLGDAYDRYDLFAMRLYYGEKIDDQGNLLTGLGQFNGNIGNMQWQTRGREIQTYGFTYDNLDRLKRAHYVEFLEGGTTSLDDKYGVNNINYDLRGNILSLNRNGLMADCSDPNGSGFGAIDILNYNYTGNQLQTVTDAGSDERGFKASKPLALYEYDANGNMTRDPNKKITIAYNFLNLPESITFDSGGSLTFVYDATGNKLRKISSNGTTTDYAGGIEYKNQAIESVYHSEGRVVPDIENSPGQIEYRHEYSIKDHLGNSRVMFSDLDGNGELVIGGEDSEILQEEHYYPFGMHMEGNWVPQVGVKNAYLYNGKELNSDFGLDWLDYGARWYDPAIGRWGQIDPLAEGYYSYSPYNYVLNNPIGNTDPDGRSVDGDFFEVHNGKVYHVGSDGEEDGKSYVVRDRAAFSNARRGGLDASSTASLVGSGAAAELSLVLPEGASSEGQALENLYNDGAATVTEGNPGGNEQAVQFIMNADDATITMSRVESEGTKNGIPRSGPGHVQLDTPGEIQQKFGPNAASFGDAHTHQAENYSSPQESAQLNSQGGDGKNARRNGTTTFSIGSLGSTIQHSKKGSSVLSPNQKVFNGGVSLVKTALNNLKR